MALDEQRVAGGTQGAVGGAASGASIGAVAGPYGAVIGAVIGGVVGAFGGALGAGSGRGTFRANRKAEFFRNSQLKLQASQITRVSGHLQGNQRVSAAGAGVRGATISGVQANAIIEAARVRTAILSGVSQEFQTGSGAVQPRDERQSQLSTNRQVAAAERGGVQVGGKGDPVPGVGRAIRNLDHTTPRIL